MCVEFRNQVARETAAGMPVAPHLQNLETDLDVAKLQLGFLDFVVAPLWNAAAMLFPAAKERIPQLEQNRAAWQAEKDRLTAAEPAAPLALVVPAPEPALAPTGEPRTP